jgi:predicted ABC-type ATPase
VKVPSLDARPIIVAIAGANGAGKSTFYHSFLAPESGLRFINADVLARQLQLDPYRAAALAESLRAEFVRARESFIFETVFSDREGSKLSFLKRAAATGYTVVLFFIGIQDAGVSEQRVAMRVAQGGHDVPAEKITTRFPRILQNLRKALAELPEVRVYDNSDLGRPYRLVTVHRDGRCIERHEPVPRWLVPLLRSKARRDRGRALGSAEQANHIAHRVARAASGAALAGAAGERTGADRRD